MSDSNTPLKKCPKCKIEYPATTEYFGACKLGKYRLQSWCRNCKNKQKRQLYAEDPEKHRDRVRQQNNKNPDRKREYSRQYRAKHPQRVREARQRWKREHPEQNAAHSQNYRARKCNAEGTHTAADIKAQFKRQKSKCYYCGCKLGKSYHVDHVVPITRGGRNAPDNLVIACSVCNNRKHDKLPHEWIEGRRLL